MASEKDPEVKLAELIVDTVLASSEVPSLDDLKGMIPWKQANAAARQSAKDSFAPTEENPEWIEGTWNKETEMFEGGTWENWEGENDPNYIEYLTKLQEGMKPSNNKDLMMKNWIPIASGIIQYMADPEIEITIGKIYDMIKVLSVEEIDFGYYESNEYVNDELFHQAFLKRWNWSKLSTDKLSLEFAKYLSCDEAVILVDWNPIEHNKACNGLMNFYVMGQSDFTLRSFTRELDLTKGDWTELKQVNNKSILFDMSDFKRSGFIDFGTYDEDNIYTVDTEYHEPFVVKWLFDRANTTDYLTSQFSELLPTSVDEATIVVKWTPVSNTASSSGIMNFQILGLEDKESNQYIREFNGDTLGWSDIILDDSSYKLINDLDTRLTEEISDLDGKIDSEVSERESVIDTLTSTVSSNYTTLDGKVSDNASAISTEVSERESAISSLSGTVDSNYTTLDDKIGAETSNRLAKEVEILKTISDESTARVSEISRIEGLIATEISDRESGDSTLNTRITNEVNTLNQAIADIGGEYGTELQDYKDIVDPQLLSLASADSTLNTAITTEINNRETSDLALDKRITDNATAIASEVSDRETVVSNLASSISTLGSSVSGNTTAIETLNTDLDNAELELQGNINECYSNITYDRATGSFTLYKSDYDPDGTEADNTGKFTVIDTDLERLPVNFEFDESTNSLVITLEDGNFHTINLSDLIPDPVVVIDDCTTDNGTQALSARQGKYLEDTKVTKIEGKNLSTNDFSNGYKTQLDNTGWGAIANIPITVTDFLVYAKEVPVSTLVTATHVMDNTPEDNCTYTILVNGTRKSVTASSGTTLKEWITAVDESVATLSWTQYRKVDGSVMGGVEDSDQCTIIDNKINIVKDAHSHSPISIETDVNNRFISDLDLARLAGMEDSANNYIHPDTHSATMIVEDDSHKFITDAELVKLSGIADSANNYTHPDTHPANIIIEDTDHKFVTDAELVKLAGIADEANKYEHPNTHLATMIVEDDDHKFVTETQVNTWNAKASTDVATNETDGLMSSTDKTQLDNLGWGSLSNNIDSSSLLDIIKMKKCSFICKGYKNPEMPPNTGYNYWTYIVIFTNWNEDLGKYFFNIIAKQSNTYLEYETSVSIDGGDAPTSLTWIKTRNADGTQTIESFEAVIDKRYITENEVLALGGLTGSFSGSCQYRTSSPEAGLLSEEVKELLSHYPTTENSTMYFTYSGSSINSGMLSLYLLNLSENIVVPTLVKQFRMGSWSPMIVADGSSRSGWGASYSDITGKSLDSEVLKRKCSFTCCGYNVPDGPDPDWTYFTVNFHRHDSSSYYTVTARDFHSKAEWVATINSSSGDLSNSWIITRDSDGKVPSSGITTSSSARLVTDTQISVWNGKGSTKLLNSSSLYSQFERYGDCRFVAKGNQLSGLPTNDSTWYVGQIYNISSIEFHVSLATYDSGLRYEGHFRKSESTWSENWKQIGNLTMQISSSRLESPISTGKYIRVYPSFPAGTSSSTHWAIIKSKVSVCNAGSDTISSSGTIGAAASYVQFTCTSTGGGSVSRYHTCTVEWYFVPK